MADTNVIPLGNAAAGNARKAQMVEHFARKLDLVLADGASDLSVVFVIHGLKPGFISTCVSWDTTESGSVPVRMTLTDASALILGEAAKMRGEEPDSQP